MTDFDRNIVKPIEELTRHRANIKTAYQQLNDDISAMYSPEIMESLAYVESHDLQAFEKTINDLKEYRIASEVRRRVKQFSRKSPNTKRSMVLPFPTNAVQAQNPFGKSPVPGFLVTYDYAAEKQVLVAESEGALLVAEYLSGQLAYSEHARTWHRFDGVHWEPLSTETSANKLLLELVYIGAQPLGFKNNYRNNIRSLIADGDMLPLPEAKHDLLPFQNGLLNTKTSELLPITPEHAQSWVLPYDYNPTAKCPSIKKWLFKAVDGDQDTVEFLRAWLAALLHGRADLQKFLHLLGRGGTGKGTFFRLAKALIGEHNTSTTTLKTMEYSAFETANFYRKRLIVITDSDKFNGSVNILKAITGQDPIRLERKYQQAGSFTFDGLVIIASNENLVTTDHTSGIERRRLTVRFDNVFSEDEKMTWEKQGGEALLHAELPGLVNWLLELSQGDISRLIRMPPQRTKVANFEAMIASNPLAEWLTECCMPDPEAWTQIGVKEEGVTSTFKNTKEWLYANYLEWCQQHNRSPHSVRRFREILIDTARTLGLDVHESRRGSGMGINGIRFRKDWEDNFSEWQPSVGFSV